MLNLPSAEEGVSWHCYVESRKSSMPVRKIKGKDYGTLTWR